MDPIFQDGIEAYAKAHSSPEPEYLTKVAEATQAFSPDWGMMVGQLEGRLLKMLVAMQRPQRILEIGTFTGYSALSMAEALPDGGGIVTLEASEKHAAIAREHIAASPYAKRILVRVGPALDTLRTLSGPFDLVFIDADKSNYQNYLEAVLPKLSDDGLIAIDNVLWSARVLTDANQEKDSVALRAFNDRLDKDPRFECVMLTVRDGVTLARPRRRA